MNPKPAALLFLLATTAQAQPAVPQNVHFPMTRNQLLEQTLATLNAADLNHDGQLLPGEQDSLLSQTDGLKHQLGIPGLTACNSLITHALSLRQSQPQTLNIGESAKFLGMAFDMADGDHDSVLTQPELNALKPQAEALCRQITALQNLQAVPGSTPTTHFSAATLQSILGAH